MKEMILFRNLMFVKIFYIILAIICFIFGLSIPFFAGIAHPLFGIAALGLYLVLIFVFFKKSNFFAGRIKSIEISKKFLKIIEKGFFKIKTFEEPFQDIDDLVLEIEEFSRITGKHRSSFRVFKLSATIDGEVKVLSKSLLRKTINLIAIDLSNSLNKDVRFICNDGGKFIDSKSYHFKNFQYKYSYSPIVYLINAFVFSAIYYFGKFSFFTFAAVTYFWATFFLSRASLKNANKAT